MNENNSGLTRRFHRHLERTRLLPAGRSVCVALSGGLDSVVLVHLLNELQGRWGWRLSAAHFDHRMRTDSERDAGWVRSLCRELEIPLEVGRARQVPSSEADARKMRYAFLFQAREDLGADLLATAHQADDQAETVLFRLRRGTGLRGAAGIPERRDPNVVRPLLPFWRSELEAYAGERQLVYVEDPTNRDPSYARRNWIRHRLLPALEGERPNIRRELNNLAGLARRANRLLGERLEAAEKRLIIESSEGHVVVARTELLAYDTSALRVLLRHLVARVGPRPGRTGTRAALEFIKHRSSGRRIELSGGVELCREFDRLIIRRAEPADGGGNTLLSLHGADRGEGLISVGGCRWRVIWTEGGSRLEADGDGVARFATNELRWPLTVRRWLPGDRIRLAAGTRKLKKVFGDRKVGRWERHRLPVIADEEGVLWVPGLVRGARAQPSDRDRRFTVRVSRER